MSPALRVGIAGVAAGLLIGAGLHGPLDAGAAGFAAALGVVAAVYPGALLAARPTPVAVAAELAAAAATLAFAWAAIVHDPLWLVPGYLLHAAWDWAHHALRAGVDLARWYPPACAGADAAIALTALWVFWP